MKAIIQRVKKASVLVGKTKQCIGKGFVVLLAATHTDSEADADYLAGKIANLRIMSDKKGLMNKTLHDVNGEILVVSQFTLFARTKKGNRPSFIDAANPSKAEKLYEIFLDKLNLLHHILEQAQLLTHLLK